MITIIDKILDQLARTGSSQDLGVVLLLEDDSPVVYNNPVALSLIMHVGVMAGPIYVEKQRVICHLACLHVLVSSIELDPVQLRTGLGAGN